MVILYVPTVTGRAIAFFLNGLFMFRKTATYACSTEFVPLENRSYAITAINFYNQLALVFFGIYCMFISRDWYAFLLVNFLTNVFAFFILFVMPESPRWLIYGGRVDEAIKSLNYIAWFNGCDRDSYIPEDATFEEMAELIATDQTNAKTG